MSSLSILYLTHKAKLLVFLTADRNQSDHMKRVGEGDDHVEKADINMAHVLMLLSRGQNGHDSIPVRSFECKTCNRRFPSFQALGGHRASHKKPRVLEGQDTVKSPVKPRKVHECSICGVEFPLGQALGGHMRRHRVSPGSCAGVVDQEESIRIKEDDGGDEKRTLKVDLDLNLTPTENDSELRLLTFSLGLPMVIL